MFRYGADYYPEHWPEERWAVDARLMQEAGFNVVRLAEFAWSRMEPTEGRYDFAWLDRAIEVLGAHGIDIVLGTPSASPPPWLMAQHPDAFNVWPDGVRATYGSRRTTCPTSPIFRSYAERITRAMAEHYHDHPRVIGWQIDNEFGDPCYCELCQAAFQSWLHNHYDSLAALNAAWGTVFWSHEYTDWAHIPLPVLTTRTPLGIDMTIVANPGLALDFARFVSDTYVDFQNAQLAVLRAACPGHFVTHNFMGFSYDKLNYFDLAAPLDLVSWDNYPRGFWADDKKAAPDIALEHVTMYGLKQQPFWVMEAQSGRTGWHIMGAIPRPGELRLWAYQAVAHGADGIVFFRWRTCRFGTEQLWQGILDYDGIPRRRYHEVKRMGEELRRVGEDIGGGEVRADAAIMLSYDSRFAFQAQPNSPAFSYPQHVRDYHAALHRQHIPAAIIAPDADLTPYRLLIVPALVVTEETTAARLRLFVEQGGTLVITMRSGFKNHYNMVVDIPLPGLLAELCGIEIDDMDVLRPGQRRRIEFEPGAGDQGAATAMCEILALKGAEVLACYAEDYYAGQPAAAIHSLGRGHTIYVGTMGDPTLVTQIVNRALRLAHLSPLAAASAEVEVTRRTHNDTELLFVLNHTSESQSFLLNGAYQDKLSGRLHSGTVSLAPYDVLILGTTGDEVSGPKP